MPLAGRAGDYLKLLGKQVGVGVTDGLDGQADLLGQAAGGVVHVVGAGAGGQADEEAAVRLGKEALVGGVAHVLGAPEQLEEAHICAKSK